MRNASPPSPALDSDRMIGNCIFGKALAGWTSGRGSHPYNSAIALSLGIDVRGRSCSLTVNYRTTEQIRRFADKILSDPGDTSTDENEDRKSVSLLSGPEPRVQSYGTVAEEIDGAAAAIRALLTEGYDAQSIAIFSHGQPTLKERAEAACSKSGIACRELSDDSPIVGNAISIGTMHRAKGLEFKAVILMGCDDKLLPMRSVIDRLSDAADRESSYRLGEASFVCRIHQGS